MPTLTLERTYPASLERVFEFVSKAERLVEWWGPEGAWIPEHDLSMDREGPWYSVMRLDNGNDVKVSGHVTHVNPPRSIGFTWAWHDENDVRGVESHVTIKLEPAEGGGTALTLTHADLPDQDMADRHKRGWESTLRKLDGILAN